MPTVSVIIPAYNAEEYIKQTLESVANQTLADIEVIVVDDGSTDSTTEIIQGHVDADSRFSLVKQANQYAGVARNNGMKHANGKYYYFLDADDYIEPNALEMLVDAIEQNDADIAIARSEAFDNQTGATWLLENALNNLKFDTPIPQEEYAAKLFQSFVGWPWDKLFRTSFIKETGLEFQALRTTNDALFCFCALAEARHITCVDSVLFHHRTNNAKSLEGSRAKSWNNAITAIKAIRARLEASDAGRRCLPSFYKWVANYSIWTVQTLPSDEADNYLKDIKPFIDSLSQPANANLDIYESAFVELIAMPKAAAISRAISALKEKDVLWNELCEKERKLNDALKQESTKAEQMRMRAEQTESKLAAAYSSHSYRLGNMLLKPLSAAKNILNR